LPLLLVIFVLVILSYRTTTGIAALADHGLHGWVRL